ncbi:MAG: peptide ABC transporter substrate-binding protein [Chloroflexota bacterium]
MSTRPDVRWQLLLAIACLGLVLSLLSFQAQSAALCTTRVPAAGGSFVEGVVGAPRYLNPLLSDNNLVDRELTSLIFDGLTRYDEDGRLAPALAQEWSVDEDGRTVRFILRDDVRWHDGEPVTAEDVVFTYQLLQNESFPAPQALRTLWQSVTISQTGESGVVFTLPEPYSPFLDATTRGILPRHILGDVPPAEIPDHDFNLAPVGTGPFVVPPGENWQRTGRLRLVPNPGHWPQGIQLDNLEFRFFPDIEHLLEAYEAGDVQAINNVPASAVLDVAENPGTRLYNAPLPRYTQLLFNLSDQGNPAMQQREVRQGLAHALDRDWLIDQALNGQGIPFHGPYLPTSWAYNPGAVSQYPYESATATQLLDEAGWPLPEGAQVRQREDTRLALRLLFLDDTQYRALADAIAQQWAEVGVSTEPVPVAADDLRTALAERNFDVALTQVAAGGDPDLYDFWSQEAIIRGHNFAAWNSRRASEALEQARQVWDTGERRAYYDAFLAAFSSAAPAVTLYQHVYTYALSDQVQEVDIGRIDHPRERYDTIANWFLLYRDVAVACPEPTGEAPGEAP